MAIATSCTFDRENINKEEDYEGHLLVSLKGEETDDRTPVEAILVLDVSGSMSWSRGSEQRKIDAVKETARTLVDNLSSQDEIAIVTFRDIVNVVLPRQKVENKEAIYAAIDSIMANANTNFSGGILQGLSEVDEKFEGVKRLMVLTDGLPNVGVTDPEGLRELVSSRDSSATLSFFGFGMDCNQELLTSLAQAGGGSYYFIENTNDVKNVFARELGGILACRAQNIEVKISPNKGNEILEVLNDFTVEELEDGAGKVNAEDLYAGELKSLVLKMKVSKPEGKPKARPFSIAKVEISYHDLESKKKEVVEHNVKVSFVKPEDADEKPNVEVIEQVAILEAAKAQREAVKLADAGKFEMAQQVLTSGGVMLDMAADLGSSYCSEVIGDYQAASVSLKKKNYRPKAGRKLSAAAAGVRRGKLTNDGVFAGRVANNRQQEMVENFQKKPESQEEPQPADPAPSSSSEPKGFSKKRSRG